MELILFIRKYWYIILIIGIVLIIITCGLVIIVGILCYVIIPKITTKPIEPKIINPSEPKITIKPTEPKIITKGFDESPPITHQEAKKIDIPITDPYPEARKFNNPIEDEPLKIDLDIIKTSDSVTLDREYVNNDKHIITIPLNKIGYIINLFVMKYIIDEMVNRGTMFRGFANIMLNNINLFPNLHSKCCSLAYKVINMDPENLASFNDEYINAYKQIIVDDVRAGDLIDSFNKETLDKYTIPIDDPIITALKSPTYGVDFNALKRAAINKNIRLRFLLERAYKSMLFLMANKYRNGPLYKNTILFCKKFIETFPEPTPDEIVLKETTNQDSDTKHLREHNQLDDIPDIYLRKTIMEKI